MTHGENLPWLESLQEAGTEIPLLKKQPVLDEHLFPVWEAFLFLSHYRTVGMAEGAIPLSEVWGYLALYAITGETYRQWFVECLRGLDQAYLKERHGKSRT
jgi:hypothetical protein